MLASDISRLLNGTGDAAFAVDDQQLICAWNRAAEAFLGYTTSQALGKPCHSIFQGQNVLGLRICSEQCPVMNCALRGQEISSFEMELVASSGRRIWVMASSLVFRDERSGRHLVVHILHDISRWRQVDILNSKLIRLAQQIAALPRQEKGSLPPTAALSEREKTVLRLLADGKNPAAIANDLGITSGTLRNHLSHVNEKLGTHNRLEAIFQAKRRGII